MYSVTGVLEGLAPFLFNRFVDPSVLDTGVSGVAPVGARARSDEAEKKVYVGSDGLLYLPAWNFKRALIDGARKSKLKVNKTGLGELVSASVFPAGNPSFGVRTRDFMSEVVGRIPPRTGAAALIRRPALDRDWHLSFALDVLEEPAMLPPEFLRSALAFAGSRIGIGSWRPEFGRFRVVTWTVADAVAAPIEKPQRKRRSSR